LSTIFATGLAALMTIILKLTEIDLEYLSRYVKVFQILFWCFLGGWVIAKVCNVAITFFKAYMEQVRGIDIPEEVLPPGATTPTLKPQEI
jgi:hypothetical protein